ncbi:MAG: hypothetical protein AABY15_07640 [Nanoarchaeota archaeon]
MNLLAGKRTYIAVIVLFLLGGFQAIGVIDEQAFRAIEAFAVGLGIFGLRKAK